MLQRTYRVGDATLELDAIGATVTGGTGKVKEVLDELLEEGAVVRSGDRQGETFRSVYDRVPATIFTSEEVESFLRSYGLEPVLEGVS